MELPLIPVSRPRERKEDPTTLEDLLLFAVILLLFVWGRRC